MYEKTYGAKYDQSLSTADIAARVRADVKDAIKTGLLPVGLKVSVRSQSFSGGSAIRIAVIAVPATFRIQTEEYLRHCFEEPNRCWTKRHEESRTEESKRVLALISSFADAYNYDGSDIQSDYFSVNFYDGKAEYAHGVRSAEENAYAAGRVSMDVEVEAALEVESQVDAWHRAGGC